MGGRGRERVAKLLLVEDPQVVELGELAAPAEDVDRRLDHRRRVALARARHVAADVDDGDENSGGNDDEDGSSENDVRAEEEA